jgi:hypothetical protein
MQIGNNFAFCSKPDEAAVPFAIFKGNNLHTSNISGVYARSQRQQRGQPFVVYKIFLHANNHIQSPLQ